MRTISVWICLLTLAAVFTQRAPGQDAATQAQLDKITGEIQDVQDSLNSQEKQITDLEKKISDMQDKINTPSGNDYASADDLKKLAEQVQEIDKKREEDNKKILDALEKLSQGGGFHRPPADNSVDANPGPNSSEATTATTSSSGNQNGYQYKIELHNTLAAIAKAYRAQGVKVTVADILKANPGLNPNKLVVGQTIFIPAGQ
ncbi:MAG TPA: LysM peptidoglycan-binding domain-containing protein [Candidatus Sulfotelmatobacter sp.]|nr:LysM peptidoglycan-binding domain-containing protein [Candidatus Sulfotelmatobacter sp.]